MTTVAFLVLGAGCRRTEQDRRISPPDDSNTPSLSPSPTGNAVDWTKPALDLPADRLSERVDGAEVKLRRLGCRRLMVWRWAQQQADLELFAFTNAEGAAKMLAEQIGTERTANVPGDEGWIGSNVLYFRRGAVFVRVVADGPRKAEDLREMAQPIAQALTKAVVVP